MDVARPRPWLFSVLQGLLLLPSAGTPDSYAQETPAAKVALREEVATDRATRVEMSLNAKGTLRPEGTAKEPVSPVEVRVQSRLSYAERPSNKVGYRSIERAEATIEGAEGSQATSNQLRPEVRSLAAVADGGDVRIFSFSGPLTRPELELVHVPADPLGLADLLPANDVAVEDRWRLPDTVARSFSGYDRIRSNTLEAQLKAMDADLAAIEFEGELEGDYFGAKGRMRAEGSARFDRKANLITHLELRRSEARVPGPVEPGLEFQSVLKWDRSAIPVPETLSDARLEAMGLPPETQELLYRAPGDRFQMRHDRRWFTVAEDAREVVLRRVERGGVVAQCNLVNGPTLGPEERANLAAFREEIRKAIGPRFRRFLDVGEVSPSTPGETRFRVAVEGSQDNVPILWIYYRILGPSGEQVVAAFTLRKDQQAAFADDDLKLIGSFAWGAGRAEAR